MRQDVQKTRELEERFSELQKNLDEKRCQYVVAVDIFGASFLWYQNYKRLICFDVLLVGTKSSRLGSRRSCNLKFQKWRCMFNLPVTACKTIKPEKTLRIFWSEWERKSNLIIITATHSALTDFSIKSPIQSLWEWFQQLKQKLETTEANIAQNEKVVSQTKEEGAQF